MLNFLTKRRTLATLSFISLATIVSFDAFDAVASSLLGGYTQPVTRRKVGQRRSLGTGSRSDCQNTLEPGSITLLVPEAEMAHRTASSRPSFFFHSAEAPTKSVLFTLIDPDVAEPLIEKTINIPQPGYWQIIVPPEVDLQPERVYLWHIGIPCANNPQRVEHGVRAAVEQITPSSELLTQLQRVNSTEEKAALFASSGYWYDALTLANQTRSELGSSNYWHQLLSSVGIEPQPTVEIRKIKL